MTRVIHTGDTHLGYAQYHSEGRREDFLAAFQAVVDDAIEDDVDAVVHAGDLFHSRRPDLEDLVGTIEVVSELRAADIPLYAVVGNHEGTRRTQWLDLLESLGLATRLGADPETVGDVALYGLDYLPAAQREASAYTFEPTSSAESVLVSHGPFTPFPYGSWDLETVLETSSVDFSAVLLGDNHEPLREDVCGVPTAYCGSTERVSADERDPRGYNLVTVDDGVRISRRGIDTREFVFVDIDLNADEGGEWVRNRIDERDVEDAVVIVTIDGVGDRVVPAEIESFATDQGALVTRVNDRRELDTDEDVGVEFADPDAAVRDRVRELGLSSVAESIDDTVRSPEVPDSNVGETVEDRVRDIVDDPEPFYTPEDRPDETGDGDGSTTDEDTDTASGDGQVTMEDYL